MIRDLSKDEITSISGGQVLEEKIEEAQEHALDNALTAGLTASLASGVILGVVSPKVAACFLIGITSGYLTYQSTFNQKLLEIKNERTNAP